MGLDLELFDGPVDRNLLCSLCGHVLAQPETSLCQHVFCKDCLDRNVNRACPRCGAGLSKSTSPASSQIGLRLLELRIRCDHKCGAVLPLGQLPEHVNKVCPNTPVACEYSTAGCKMYVRRRDLEEHANECDYRPVVCEACGQKTIFKDLYPHQSRRKCVEMRLRHQLIQAVKSTRKDVKRHQKFIERQQIRVDQQTRRIEMEHIRRMNSSRLQRQRDANYHYTSSERPGTMHRLALTSRSNNNISSRLNDFHTHIHQQHQQKQQQEYQQQQEQQQDELFLTGICLDDSLKSSFAVEMMSDHRQPPDPPQNCKNCKKHFLEGRNRPNACRWHAGPIVELFGGTCYSCGRLDYQKGCMMGFHES